MTAISHGTLRVDGYDTFLEQAGDLHISADLYGMSTDDDGDEQETEAFVKGVGITIAEDGRDVTLRISTGDPRGGITLTVKLLEDGTTRIFLPGGEDVQRHEHYAKAVCGDDGLVWDV